MRIELKLAELKLNVSGQFLISSQPTTLTPAMQFYLYSTMTAAKKQ